MTKKKKNLYEINFYRFLYKIIYKNVFLFNFFINSMDLNIFFKNFKIFKKILNFYSFSLNNKILFSFKFKYSWVFIKNDFNKFYNLSFNFYQFNEFFYKNNFNINFDKFNLLNNYINFKNKFGFFKKINSIKNYYINKNNLTRNYNFESNFNNFKIDRNLNFKNYDFVEKKLFYYLNNRKIFKNIFQKNKKKEYYLNKFFKKIIKNKSKNFINFFEFSIKNILLISNFLLSKKDLNFFIINNYVYLNNNLLSNINYILKKNDIVSIIYNKYYYFLYKNYLNTINFNFIKYSNFLRRNKYDNFKNEFFFLNKFLFFKNDIPNYIEVDYISMSIFLVYNNIFNYNSQELKILNVFLKRLNNWKYLT